MHIDILTIFPDMFTGPFNHSIIKRAKEKSIIDICLHDIRKYANNKHKKVDDYPFGGESGMVMMVEPIALCIEDLKSQRTYDEVIYMSPDGELLDQKLSNQCSLYENIIILCGHYKGIDERIREHFITKEISIGDYVLSGGELAAAVLVDTVGRLIPGVLNDETSALFDSFQDDLLAPPVYTRPEVFNDWKVPEVLLSGHDKNIEEWRYEQSLKRTIERRPDLIKKDESLSN